ncbi:MAG: MobF family relaxase [Solirubrobacterales bacterium]
MLSIGKLGKGQENYYLEKVAEGAEDYYSGEGEAEGQWLGGAAKDLGLSGEIEPDQLTAMLTGQNPATGEPLGLRPVPDPGPVPGFDLTFSAPKSVSLTWALGGEEAAAEVAEAHQRSVEAALGYMQRHACWTRAAGVSAKARPGAPAREVKGAGQEHGARWSRHQHVSAPTLGIEAPRSRPSTPCGGRAQAPLTAALAALGGG